MNQKNKSKDKKYFHSLKKHDTKLRKRPFMKFLKFVFRSVSPKTEFIFTTEMPKDEAVVFLGNHSKEYGPISFINGYRKPFRFWSAPSMMYRNKVHGHVMLYDKYKTKGIARLFAHIYGYLLSFFMPKAMISLECIPAYSNINCLVTFDKTVESLKEGKDVVIFPEQDDPEEGYEYIYQLHNGFMRFEPQFYKETGKILKFYPCYVCQDLHKVIVGSPVSFEPDINIKKQIPNFKKQVMNQIEALAKSLPPHKKVLREENLQTQEMWDKYYDKDRYSSKRLYLDDE